MLKKNTENGIVMFQMFNECLLIPKRERKNLEKILKMKRNDIAQERFRNAFKINASNGAPVEYHAKEDG